MNLSNGNGSGIGQDSSGFFNESSMDSSLTIIPATDGNLYNGFAPAIVQRHHRSSAEQQLDSRVPKADEKADVAASPPSAPVEVKKWQMKYMDAKSGYRDIKRKNREQTKRARQLLAAVTAKLQEKESELQQLKTLHNSELTAICQNLLRLQASMKREKDALSRILEEKDAKISEQQAEIDHLSVSLVIQSGKGGIGSGKNYVTVTSPFENVKKGSSSTLPRQGHKHHRSHSASLERVSAAKTSSSSEDASSSSTSPSETPPSRPRPALKLSLSSGALPGIMKTAEGGNVYGPNHHGQPQSLISLPKKGILKTASSYGSLDSGASASILENLQKLIYKDQQRAGGGGGSGGDERGGDDSEYSRKDSGDSGRESDSSSPVSSPNNKTSPACPTKTPLARNNIKQAPTLPRIVNNKTGGGGGTTARKTSFSSSSNSSFDDSASSSLSTLSFVNNGLRLSVRGSSSSAALTTSRNSSVSLLESTPSSLLPPPPPLPHSSSTLTRSSKPPAPPPRSSNTKLTYGTLPSKHSQQQEKNKNATVININGDGSKANKDPQQPSEMMVKSKKVTFREVDPEVKEDDSSNDTQDIERNAIKLLEESIKNYKPILASSSNGPGSLNNSENKKQRDVGEAPKLRDVFV